MLFAKPIIITCGSEKSVKLSLSVQIFRMNKEKLLLLDTYLAIMVKSGEVNIFRYIVAEL